MRRATILLSALALAACAPGMGSRHSLFKPGGPPPADGLWALLPKDCAKPASASMVRWPSCAKPVWLSGGTATIIESGDVAHVAFVMADGTPRIVELGAPEDRMSKSAAAMASGMGSMLSAAGAAEGDGEATADSTRQEPAGDASDDAPADAPPDAPAAEEKDEPNFIFFAFEPSGPAPYRAGRIWRIRCPDGDVAGVRKVDDGCLTDSAQAVRDAAKLPAKEEISLMGPDESNFDAVWIAPAE